MPTCRRCENSFPNKIVIKGKTRILSSRVYCLDCSPFGLHNTRPIDETGLKQGKPRRKYNPAHYTRKRRIALKKKMVDLLGGKCSSCGYSRCVSALTFHHRDPEQKKFNLGDGYYHSWDETQQELLKCDLLCHNCHSELHFEEDVAVFQARIAQG